MSYYCFMPPKNFLDYSEVNLKFSKSVNQTNLESFLKLLDEVGLNNTIFSCGNGGSASTAEHFSADFSTGSARRGRGLRVECLSSNLSIISQVANDIDFSEIFSHQIRVGAREKDILVVFTASGNSKNLISALKAAKELGVTSVGFTGFDGGEVRRLCDLSIHTQTPFGEYGAVENIHLSLLHYLVDRFRAKSISV